MTPIPSKSIAAELEVFAFAQKWAAHFAKHGTGYYEHLEKDAEFVAAIKALLTTQLDGLLAELPKGYYSPGERRQELGEVEFQRQFNYNLGLVECKELIKKHREALNG